MGAALRPAFSQDTPSDIIAKACQVRRKQAFYGCLLYVSKGFRFHLKRENQIDFILENNNVYSFLINSQIKLFIYLFDVLAVQHSCGGQESL